MLLLLVLLQLVTAFQVRAAAIGPASFEVTRVILTIVNAFSQDASLKKSAELWVDASGTRCLLETQFPVSPDQWSFCSGGEYYIRARGLTDPTDIKFDLDVARMGSSGLVGFYTLTGIERLTDFVASTQANSGRYLWKLERPRLSPTQLEVRTIGSAAGFVGRIRM